jgi:hypothetical protein
VITESKKEATVTTFFSKYSDDELNSLIDHLKEIQKKRQQEYLIPVSLFSNRKLGVLETAVKFLKENSGLSFSQIALLLKRDQRTIWATYNKSQKKNGHPFHKPIAAFSIPVNILSDRKFAPLESLVLHLHDSRNMQFASISRLLNRNYRTVWLSYHNTLKKRGLG